MAPTVRTGKQNVECSLTENFLNKSLETAKLNTLSKHTHIHKVHLYVSPVHFIYVCVRLYLIFDIKFLYI